MTQIAMEEQRSENRKPNMIGFTALKEKYLDHRYPILMLDRVTDYEPGKYIEALKAVTGNSPECVGHFPNRAIMPGTTVLQGHAQLAIVMFKITNGFLSDDEMTVISSISGRFLEPVPPGVLLRFRLDVKHRTDGVIMYRGVTTVDGKAVVRAAVTLAKTKIAKYGAIAW